MDPATSPRIAVYGSSTAREGNASWTLGYDLGRELAQAGAAVMTGGYGGTMEAVSRGAHEAGGHVVGVTVDLFEARGPANAFVRERVHTPDLYERLRYLVHHADGFVTLPGSIGTLTELYLTWTMLSVQGRPAAPLIVLGDMWRDLLDAHRHPALIPDRLFEHVQIADTPADAARRVLALAERP
jgi:uncharacterized protein (TIGR00730 family)